MKVKHPRRDYILAEIREGGKLMLALLFSFVFLLPLFAFIFPAFVKGRKQRWIAFGIWLLIWLTVGAIVFWGQSIWLLYLWIAGLVLGIGVFIGDAIRSIRQAEQCAICDRLVKQGKLEACPKCGQHICNRCSAYEFHLAGIGSHEDFLGCMRCFKSKKISYF